jgi:hypothetical protein
LSTLDGRERLHQPGIVDTRAPVAASPAEADAALPEFVDRHRRLFVLTGAGCSTASGIGD